MKNTKRYLSIFLALALAAPVFTGCDNGLDEYKSGETLPLRTSSMPRFSS